MISELWRCGIRLRVSMNVEVRASCEHCRKTFNSLRKVRGGAPRSNLQIRCVSSGLSDLGAEPRDQALHELRAFFDLRAFDPLIRLVRLLN